jgi:hypothetical protein
MNLPKPDIGSYRNTSIVRAIQPGPSLCRQADTSNRHEKKPGGAAGPQCCLEEKMTALLTAIVTWLSVHFELPATFEHPEVIRLPRVEIAKLRNDTAPLTATSSVVAAYDDEANVILIPKDWSGRTPADLSILVHEMVHHLQNKAGRTYHCPSAREALAYAAQAKWLGQFGSSLEHDFNIDSLTLKVLTGCMVP